MTQPAMLTGRQLYDTVPLGAFVRYSDGTPQPPARHKRKLAEWSSSNGVGRLVCKTPADEYSGPSFKLHIGNFASGGVTIMETYKVFSINTPSHYSVVTTPRQGQVAVLEDLRGVVTLLHLDDTLAGAEMWLARNPHSNTRIAPADAPRPQTYTYLQDPAHGWLIVTRDDLANAGFTPADFSVCSYVSGDRLALEEDCDMQLFLNRLLDRGVEPFLLERHTNADAPVRRWASNQG